MVYVVAMNFTKAVKAELLMFWTMIQGVIGNELESTELREGSGIVTRARNAGTVISVVVIGVVALVGLLIFGEVYNAMPEMPSEVEGTAEDVVGGFADAIGLVPIILLVLLASVVIGVVQRMRGM